MKTVNKLRARMGTDLSLDKPYVELLDEEGKIIFDIFMNGNGDLLVGVSQDAVGKYIHSEMVLVALRDAFEQIRLR